MRRINLLKHTLRGEQHWMAKLSDRDVELIRELREKAGLSYRAIAMKFDVPRATIAGICSYRRR